MKLAKCFIFPFESLSRLREGIKGDVRVGNSPLYIPSAPFRGVLNFIDRL